ncbi:MAG: DUF1957 domain-containing protein [Acidobacteria bacterium]|nr:DUF1957 domain-containing protein [Acidobacteriota bacterium]
MRLRNYGVEDLLKDAGIDISSGFARYPTRRAAATLRRPRAGDVPMALPLFARDVETSQQVWSAEVGYPGDPFYREFYRDVGWDLPMEYLKPHLHSDGSRRHLGLKYYRITGRDVPQNRKKAYVPAIAKEKAAMHAFDFLGRREDQARKLREIHEGHPPLVTSPYDAELYGHWWFEGPMFIDYLFRQIHFDQDEITAVTPGDYLDAKIPIQIQTPSASSWGEAGYYKVWINEGNSWMYPYQHDAERKMTALANRFHHPNDVERRVLEPACGELLLAQSSDWALDLSGTTVQYSSNRFKSHIHRFNLLAKCLKPAISTSRC